MNNKSVIFLVSLFCAIALAGFYGALHDQLSYTLSPEYFTHFKFVQFGLPWAYEAPRFGAAWVGVLATWWMGVLIWLPIGIIALFFTTARQMRAALLRAFVIVLLTTTMTGLVGLSYGFLVVTPDMASQILPTFLNQVPNKVAFVQVGFLHNASYLGGAIGLCLASIYVLARLYILKKRGK